MRLRNVKGSREIVASAEYVIQQPESNKGIWKQFFNNQNPLYIEIGMGKGKFIGEMAAANPNKNYLGIEKYSSVLIRALEKRPELLADNLFYIRMDAVDINDIFAQEEVDGIYLNFSDPWPKDRYAKRRLTSHQFLDRYDKLLSKDGTIIFKTDNRSLFDFSLEEIRNSKWQLKSVTYDLHHSDLAQGNIMTEYEERFSAEGKPICRLEIFR